MRHRGMNLKTVTVLTHKEEVRTITVCAKSGDHKRTAERYFRGGRRK